MGWSKYFTAGAVSMSIHDLIDGTNSHDDDGDDYRSKMCCVKPPLKAFKYWTDFNVTFGKSIWKNKQANGLKKNEKSHM